MAQRTSCTAFLESLISLLLGFRRDTHGALHLLGIIGLLDMVMLLVMSFFVLGILDLQS